MSRFRFSILAASAAMIAFAGCADKDLSMLEPDTTPPVVSAVATSEGRVTWTTDESATCVLLYGSEAGLYDHYGYNVSDGGVDHQVDLIDVGPGTYYARVMATDGAGNSSTSPEVALTLAAALDGDKMMFTMVDVGWGDCHFMEFPNGATVMIDAGAIGGSCSNFDHRAKIDAFLAARGIAAPSGIDYMILTHDHCDHYGYMPRALLSRYYDTIFLAPELAAESVWPRLDPDLTAKDIEHHGLVEGQTGETETFLDWDREHGVKVKVLSAGAGRFFTSGQSGDSVNCDSAVLKVSYGLVDFLLMGDGEEFVEDRIIKTYPGDLPCEVLKVGHHGNDDASSAPFLRRVGARVGLIPNSLAENDGVFDQSVISLLRDDNVDYYVSDRTYMNAGRYDVARNGNVTVTTDGETFAVSSWE